MPTIGYTNGSQSISALRLNVRKTSLMECVNVLRPHATIDAITPANTLSIIIYCVVLMCWMRHSLNLLNVLNSLYFRCFLMSITLVFRAAI